MRQDKNNSKNRVQNSNTSPRIRRNESDSDLLPPLRPNARDKNITMPPDTRRTIPTPDGNKPLQTVKSAVLRLHLSAGKAAPAFKVKTQERSSENRGAVRLSADKSKRSLCKTDQAAPPLLISAAKHSSEAQLNNETQLNSGAKKAEPPSFGTAECPAPAKTAAALNLHLLKKSIYTFQNAPQ